MTQQINIQWAVDDKREAIIALLQAEKLPVEDLPVFFENFLTAIDGDKVIGAVGIELYGVDGLLRSLVVDSSYRNHGIATKLVQAIENQASELQLKNIYLLTETAKEYFDRKGYVVITREDVPEAVKQSSEFSHVCPVSAVVMQKQTK
jgi:amino-acid N-acetyltransferase